MKALLNSIWFWMFVLLLFLVVIFHDSELEKDAQSKYVKERMLLHEVHFSEMDKGFEHLRIFADDLDMDDTQTNMIATHVRAVMFDRAIATKTATLTASSAFKNPYEIRFVGDARIVTSENERLRTEELRYFLSRKELFSSSPVTIWKDDMILTGRNLTYETQTHEGYLKNDVLIRIWKNASQTASTSRNPADAHPPTATHSALLATTTPAAGIASASDLATSTPATVASRSASMAPDSYASHSVASHSVSMLPTTHASHSAAIAPIHSASHPMSIAPIQSTRQRPLPSPVIASSSSARASHGPSPRENDQ